MSRDYDKIVKDLLKEHERKESFKKTFNYQGRNQTKINEDTLFNIPKPPYGVKMFKKNKKAQEKWNEYIKLRESASKFEEKTDED